MGTVSVDHMRQIHQAAKHIYSIIMNRLYIGGSCDMLLFLCLQWKWEKADHNIIGKGEHLLESFSVDTFL